MLARIAAFELRYQLRTPVFFIGFAIFFLFGFAAVGGTFLNMVSGEIHVNSPYAILLTLADMSLPALFVVVAFVANVVVRDQETRFAALLFATPVAKHDYLFGRFAGAMMVALMLLASVPLAIMIGSLMTWLDPQRVGPFAAMSYLYAWLLVLPTILISGSVFFALAVLTRSMMWTYVGAVLFLVLYALAPALKGDFNFDHITALLDPFGIAALQVVTKYWTPVERNSLLPPLSGVLLENRMLWLSVAAVMLALAYMLFRFEARETAGRQEPPEPSEASPGIAAQAAARVLPVAFPQLRAAQAFAAVTFFEMRTVLRSPAFYILLAIGALGALPSLRSEPPTLPLTRLMVYGLQGSFTLIPNVIALYYAGELVWRERERRMDVILDVTTAPSWVFVVPKILALCVVLTGTLLAAVALAMVNQMAHGYWQLEPLHYLLWFLLPNAITAGQLAVLAVFIQSLVPHKSIGWAVMLVLIVAGVTLYQVGFEHGLYRFGYTPPVSLSDMFGMARFWVGRAWFQVYWSAFATMLAVLTVLLWRRGSQVLLTERLPIAVRVLPGAPAGILVLALCVWLGSGAYIYYNTNILNNYANHTDLGHERLLARYEKELLRYESVPQPTILAVKLDVQLYPHLARADTVGSYLLENRTGAPISVLHVRWNDPLQMRALDAGPAALEKDYGDLDYRIYRLTTPLLPGEQRTLHFSTRLEERGFPNGQSKLWIVENGTYLTSADIAPELGMSRLGLLTERNKRRRNGLPPVLHRPGPGEGSASAYHVGRHDSGFVSAEISVTTDANQIPVAQGSTVSDTTRYGRHTVVTRTDAPMLYYFSIQSARYAIVKDLWTGRDGRKVELAVYHHPGHEHDLGRILKAMKASLDVFSERFGPYPWRRLQIVEYPTFEVAQSSQAWPSIISTTEGVFSYHYNDRQAAERIDLVSYGSVGHELSHQWWGNQVVGADEQGAGMLAESFAQYSALLVMERLYGRDQIRRWLKNQLDSYLSARTRETQEEAPLGRVEGQRYVQYDKASLVMYWLKDSLGQDVLDRALRRFVAAHALKDAPYPSTADFIAILLEEAGPGHDEEIRDLFERVTVYDMRVRDATAHRRADGRYEIRFTVEGKKFYVAGKGTQTEARMDEPFDVGVFAVEPDKPGYSPNSLLKIERVALHSGAQAITMIVDQLPRVVGVDPFNEHVDRDSDDNLTAVKLQ